MTLLIDRFYVGQSVSFTKHISIIELQQFVTLTGDDNPLHVDHQYAKNTVMRKTVVHGMLTVSFISTLIGKHLPGPGSLWVNQSIDFLRPCRLGDNLLIEAKITKITKRASLIDIEVCVTNQKNERLITGICTVKVPEELVHKSFDSPIPGLIFVAGGSGGIGSLVVKDILDNTDNSVFLILRDGSLSTNQILEKYSGNPRFFHCFGDLNNNDDIKRLVGLLEINKLPVSGFVQCAANPIETINFADDSWSKVSDCFLSEIGATYELIRLISKIMSKNASIILVSSVVALRNPPKEWIGYSFSKSMVLTMKDILMPILGAKGIRINAVSPGYVNTDTISAIPARTVALAEANTPLKKIAQPNEVSDVICFLLGPKASHITGQNIVVDGGIS
ncbi:SDR family oxidoreductase [Alphaproteobacteria bacterium]|nr:SDR family oxidoreductase [Alphaproteobacteria bacterium]